MIQSVDSIFVRAPLAELVVRVLSTYWQRFPPPDVDLLGV